MKAYISGKITGDPEYKCKFMNASTVLSQTGYTVLNPAKLPDGLSKADYMRINFAMIDSADIVVFLDDWRDSDGAMLEHQYCNYIGKRTARIQDVSIAGVAFYGAPWK